MQNQERHFTIPKAIVQFVVENKLEKCLIVYLFIKSQCSGIINKKFIDFSQAKEIIGIGDKRTLKKYLEDLIKLGWIGYNSESQNLFIRSYRQIAESIGIKGYASKLTIVTSQLKQIRTVLAAALIAFKIKSLGKYNNYIIKKKAGIPALKLKGSALQELLNFLKLRNYCGLSNVQIGKLLNCSKSEANRLKIRAKELGLLQTKAKKRHLFDIENKAFHLQRIRLQYRNCIFIPKMNGKLSVYEKLTDEIIPKMYWKKG